VIEEKFWIGVEKVYKDLIFLHKFKKPDMPGKKGIITFDILRKETLWKNEDLIFLFVYNDEVYCYKEKFESKNYFKLNSLTGEIISEFGNNPAELNALREKVLDEESFEGYHFTKQFIPETEPDEEIKRILGEERNQKLVSGKIDYIILENLLLYSFHEILPDGRKMKNLFKAVDIHNGKVIFEEELNRGVTNLIPDSFFIKDNLLFLLKEKTELLVCSLRE
jgi:hypothetical protein